MMYYDLALVGLPEKYSRKVDHPLELQEHGSSEDYLAEEGEEVHAHSGFSARRS